MSKECPNCGSVLTKREAERRKCNNCNDDLSDEIASFVIGVGVGMLLDNLFDNSSSSSSSSSDNSSSFEGFGGGDFGGGGASSDW